MKSIFGKLLVILVFLVYAKSVHSADQMDRHVNVQPVVGKPMPDFVLHSVRHYSKTTVSLADFAGRWLVLDFWASFCAPCIKSLPKMNELQKRFRERVQIVMVGMIGDRSGDDMESLETMYEKFRKRHKLELAVAYDSMLSIEWDIWTVPTYIVVDNAGVVRAVSHSLTEDDLNGLLDGESLLEKPRRKQVEVDKSVDAGILFSTMLSKNTGESSYASEMEFERLDDKCIFMLRRIPLFILYRYAYIGKYGWDLVTDSLYGKVYPMPQLELTDTSEFDYSFKPGNARGLYDYTVTVDACEGKDTRYLMNLMQNDLEKYFGYQVSIETREMPCYKLVVRSAKAVAKLRSKGGDGRFPKADAAGFTVRNVPMQMIISIISKYHADKQAPIIDETAIDYNIDITLDAIMTEFNDVRRGLRRNGLDLILSRKKMAVLVIREPAS